MSSVHHQRSDENPIPLQSDPAEAVVLPIAEAKKSSRKKKPEPLGDADAARVIWRAALTKEYPPNRDRDSLDPIWGYGLEMVVDEGHAGLARFLEWVAAGHPGRLPGIKLAIEAAQEDPEPDDDGDDSADVMGFTRNDLGNARRLVARFGDRIRYHADWKSWLIWDGKRWKVDRRNGIARYAKKTVERMFADAFRMSSGEARDEALKFAVKAGSRSSIESMIKLAESERGIAVDSAELDVDHFLFNCKNGTIDLRTGVLRLHRKEDLITKLSPIAFDPARSCPLWDSFLDRFMAGDSAMIAYLQRAVGYSLTGDTSEQCFFFLHGVGDNGKSTFLFAVEKVLGDYAIAVDPALFTSKEVSEHSTEICDLDGPRCAITSECEERQKLAEAFLKRVTGGTDKLRARRMRANPYEFKPVLKLWMAGNHEPVIRGTDNGIWRRVRKVPFLVTIPPEEKDPKFPDKLLAELPGILAWCVQGCLDWQSKGLKSPDAVQEATATYRADSDTIGQYLDQRCDVNPADLVRFTEVGKLHKNYQAWCEDEGINHPLTKNAFGRALTSKGFTKKPSNGITKVFGITTKGEDYI